MTKTIALDSVRRTPTTDITTASRHIGISPSHGYALAKRGEFPCRVITVGRRYRVVVASLLALLEETDEAA